MSTNSIRKKGDAKQDSQVAFTAFHPSQDRELSFSSIHILGYVVKASRIDA
jgi:hypothetical protein